MGLGLVDILGGTGLGGIWAVFLGWFLVAAARTEQAGAEARAGLEGLRVSEIMTPEPVMVPGWITIDKFIEDYALRYRLSVFRVRNLDGGLTGLVTLDAVKRVPSSLRAAVRVDDVMTPSEEVAVARSDEVVLDLLGRARPRGTTLVIDEGRLVGMVSPPELIRALEVAAFGVAERRPREPYGTPAR